MPQIMTYIVDVNGPLSLVITSDLMQKDRQANTIKVLVQDRRDPVDLTGWSALYTMEREDGVRVVVEGQIWDNEISVTLTDACYQVAGRYAAFIRITSPDTEEKRTVLRMAGLVVNEGNGPVIDGSYIIPSLEDLLAQIAAMEAATDAANKAAERAENAAGNIEIPPEAIQDAVNAYLEENPVDSVSPEEVEEAVQAALQEAKDSGEFDGPPGPQGPQGAPGAPGVSITGVSIETGGVEPGGGGEQVQSDWNQTDATAPDFIRNKPFGEEVSYSDVLTLHQMTNEELTESISTGKIVLVSDFYVKVSDSVVKMSDLRNGFTLEFVGEEGEVVNATADNVGNYAVEYADGAIVIYDSLFCIDDQAVGIDFGDEVVFPEKGLYVPMLVFVMFERMSLSIPNFRFETISVKQIDAKYLPEATATTFYIDRNEQKIYSDIERTNMATRSQVVEALERANSVFKVGNTFVYPTHVITGAAYAGVTYMWHNGAGEGEFYTAFTAEYVFDA